MEARHIPNERDGCEEGGICKAICRLIAISDKFIGKCAILEDSAAQARVASIAGWSPHGIGGSSVILGNFGVHLVARDNMGALQLAHDHGVTAVGPPIEGMVNSIHPSMLTTNAFNRKTQAFFRDDQGSIVSPCNVFWTLPGPMA